MPKIVSIAFILLLSSATALGQAARVDLPLQTYGPNVPVSGGPLPQTIWVANSSVAICMHPSPTLAYCQAHPLTTYTDSAMGTTCPSSTPMVQLPGTTCTASTGIASNIGFWYAGGVPVDYWVIAPYGTYGPYTYNPPAILNNTNLPFPGPVCSVTNYGAVGDCSASGSTASCTNNHSAIQAAFDACYVTGGSVYFPTNLLNIGQQTVYYSEADVNPKGVPFFGSPGASGPFQSFLNSYPVVVRGAPSLDVFHVPDPSSVGYVTPRESFTVQDISIFVDGSVDASASFPYRTPGRTCMDVVTNGTAVITSAAQCEFQPGDVGQAIKVGSTTTTVLSYQSGTQVTLNTTVGSATGVTAYISAMGLPVTARIGNAAFAMDDKTGAAFSGPAKSMFRNMSIMTINGSASPTTAGFFFQGNAAPTWTEWNNVSIGGYTGFGFAFVPVSAVAPSNSIYTGIADYNRFLGVYVLSNFTPFLVYSGELHEIRNMQIFSYTGMGPQFINAYGRVGGNSKWTLDIAEMESSCTGNNGTSMRIAGDSYTINRLTPITCAGSTLQWDASNSTVADFLLSSVSANFNITGSNNKFNMLSGGDNLAGFTVSNTGLGNLIKTGSQWNPLNGTQPAREQYANPGSDGFSSVPYRNANLSRGAVALDRRGDFGDTGASAYYFNKEDLWMWPAEVKDGIGGGSGNPIIHQDATSPTGTSFEVNTTTKPNQYVTTVNNVDLRLGSQVPAGKMRVYFFAKAAAGTNMTVSVQAGVTGLVSCTGAVSTSYALSWCDADASSYSGQQFILNFSAVSQTVQIAWIRIRPWDTDLLATSLTFYGATAMTSKQGTGAKVQASTGSATASGNIFKADANGNTVDGGIAASAIPTTGSPTAGQAACIYSSGPPVVIGKCTTVVGSGGACTCAQ